MWTVSKEFYFEAAHSLPNLPKGHKCRRVHGHSYKLVVICAGELHADNSWVVDYAEIKSITQPFVDLLDHQNMNDVLKIHTTAENIAFWFYMKLRGKLPIESIQIWETPTTCCTYRPEQ